MFKIYRYCIYLLLPLIKLNLYIRIKNNKEEKDRVQERFGITKVKRPDNKLIWIHSASVGEFNSISGLINKLEKNYKILLTTSTVTAFKYAHKMFGDKIIHQYAPIDHNPWIKKFLDHWSPNFVIWVESDLWPNTLLAISKRNIKSVLLNLRISPKSYSRWIYFKKYFTILTECFDKIFAQSTKDLNLVKKLTTKEVGFIGNLKLTSIPIKLDIDKLKLLREISLNKKIILIASSHKNEEALMLEKIYGIIKKYKNIMLIIIPRHPNRIDEVFHIAKKIFPQTFIKTNNFNKQNVDCLIVSSLGEMPIYYELSDIVILGGSFINKGGHNPLEPAKRNCCILTGNSIYNWKNIYEEMSEQSACILCNKATDLSEEINKILDDSKIEFELKRMAMNYANKKQNIIDDVVNNIYPYLKGLETNA